MWSFHHCVNMFHKAINLKFKEGTSLELTFLSGEVKAYDLKALFEKYPQLESLNDRSLFLKGKLMGYYGIIWNDDLDLEVETVYEEGILVRKENIPPSYLAANAVYEARARAGISQSDLAAKSGIDQSDISKIERGVANPSISTLARLADALDMKLKISIK